jgi:hypothetical protein
VVFRGAAYNQGLTVENGQRLVLGGHIELYDVKGELQLVVEAMERPRVQDVGEGYSVLKERARARGWLSPARKRPLPTAPKAIGLITARNSHAHTDIIGSLRDRGIDSEVFRRFADVEGAGAAQAMCAALVELDEQPSHVELIVIARGGGDLSSFNDEELLQAIVNSRAPVMTAIGHREDETLADLVADARAHTPSLMGSVLAGAKPPICRAEPACPAIEPNPDVPPALEFASTLLDRTQPEPQVPARAASPITREQERLGAASIQDEHPEERDLAPDTGHPGEPDNTIANVLVIIAIVVALLVVGRALGWW